jgi:hypothetical protein
MPFADEAILMGTGSSNDIQDTINRVFQRRDAGVQPAVIWMRTCCAPLLREGAGRLVLRLRKRFVRLIPSTAGEVVRAGT